MRPPALVLLAGLVVLLTGCAADDPATNDTGVEVLPIDDVLASGIVVTPDTAGTSAILTVTTSIPLACAVIYGTDEDFGKIATDSDMEGGAHLDHAPTLVGLEPETAYRYVLQGSDAAGNLYRSDVLSFTTPASSQPSPPGRNVAVDGRVTAVSSEYSDEFVAGRAIDGDPGTEWSTDGDGDDASLTVELPDPVDVRGFGVRSRAMGDGSAIIETYEVTVDDDEVLGPFDAGIDGLAIADASVTGRTFRFDALTTTGGNTGAVEIEIYASS